MVVLGEQVVVHVVVEVVSSCRVKCSREVKVEKGEVEVAVEVVCCPGAGGVGPST